MKTSLSRWLATHGPHLARSAALLGVIALAGCAGDSPTAALPRLDTGSSSSSSDLLGSVTSLIGVKGLQRTTPLASSITVTKTIGGDGGTLAIPAAGVTVTIPRGALIAPTVISMTARSGTLVAYDFAPHGITFAKPLVFVQQLGGTNASLLTAPLIQLGYYNDPSLLTATGGLISELLGGTVDTLRWTFTAKIPHFSGYIVTCGRE